MEKGTNLYRQLQHGNILMFFLIFACVVLLVLENVLDTILVEEYTQQKLGKLSQELILYLGLIFDDRQLLWIVTRNKDQEK